MAQHTCVGWSIAGCGKVVVVSDDTARIIEHPFFHTCIGLCNDCAETKVHKILQDLSDAECYVFDRMRERMA
jgi:hypothetical protein